MLVEGMPERYGFFAFPCYVIPLNIGEIILSCILYIPMLNFLLLIHSPLEKCMLLFDYIIAYLSLILAHLDLWYTSQSYKVKCSTSWIVHLEEFLKFSNQSTQCISLARDHRLISQLLYPCAHIMYVVSSKRFTNDKAYNQMYKLICLACMYCALLMCLTHYV